MKTYSKDGLNAKIVGEYKFEELVPIKECKVGQVYKFQEHHHAIFNYDIDLSYQICKCIRNSIEVNGNHDIWLQLAERKRDLMGEWENSAIFHFPDDEQYEEVFVLKGEQVNNLISNNAV
jgi:hypothetical protein